MGLGFQLFPACVEDFVTGRTPQPPTNVVSIANPMVRRTGGVESVLRPSSHKVSNPNGIQQVLNAMILDVLHTSKFDSNAQALAKKLHARKKTQEIIESRLRPLFLEQATIDAHEDKSIVHNGIQVKFHVRFQWSLSECLNKVWKALFRRTPTQNLLSLFRRFHIELISSFDRAIQSGNKTEPIKCRKNKWVDDFHAYKFPREFEDPLFLLLQAFVDFYVEPYWKISEGVNESR